MYLSLRLGLCLHGGHGPLDHPPHLVPLRRQRLRHLRRRSPSPLNQRRLDRIQILRRPLPRARLGSSRACCLPLLRLGRRIAAVMARSRPLRRLLLVVIMLLRLRQAMAPGPCASLQPRPQLDELILQAEERCRCDETQLTATNTNSGHSVSVSRRDATAQSSPQTLPIRQQARTHVNVMSADTSQEGMLQTKDCRSWH